MRPLIAPFCLVLLAGCVSPFQQLKEANPQATDFPTALASEYQSYAESESEQGHKLIAECFSARGMKALKGETVAPALPDRNLPKRDRVELASGRTRLMAFLNNDMKRAAPQKLARAQLLFDCWQYEVAHGTNQERAPCADEFASTMGDLQQVQDSLLYGAQTSHVILFSRGNAALSEQNLAVVKGVADMLAGSKHYLVELHTYIGHHSAQQHLSQSRLAGVRRALIKAGVAPRRIRIKTEGGAKAVILSSDAVQSLNSKKITIVVKTREH
ncbi:MAG: hypothetical protein KGI29_04845 [Pseudomonadota bacterium]|nr:hypothetical protein [Pseudomonadota bacterium]MDE3038183.1 hypothetical protein [Pseudomonadota bacterium]